MKTFKCIVLALLCGWTVTFAQRTNEEQKPRGDPDPTIAWKRLYFEGYAQVPSSVQGADIQFKVSCLGANNGGIGPVIPVSASYKIYRVTGRSRLQDSDSFTGTTGNFQASFYPLHDVQGSPIYPGDNSRFPYEYRRGCNWETSLTLSGTTTATWPSGVYYAKLYVSGYEQDTSRVGYVPFVIRAANPGSTSKVLCVIAWNTYQAYNFWGGGSFYYETGSFDSPDTDGTNRAVHVVSFRRPFTDFRPGGYPSSTQMGHLNHRDRNFLAWAFEAPYPVEYCVDGDVHDQGLGLLGFYKEVVYPGHAEYWTQRERESYESNATSFKKSAGNLEFLCSNICYWKVDYYPASGTSNPDSMFCNKNSTQNGPSMWRHQAVNSDSVGGHESRLLGVEFEGANVRDTSYTVNDASHWVFRGTGLQNGNSFGFGNGTGVFETNIEPVAGGEADMRTAYSPPNTQILARCYMRQMTNQDPHRSEVSGDSLWSHMAYYEDTRTNSRVFANGAMGWCASLFGTDGASVMQVMHRSLLDHFSGTKYVGSVYTSATNPLRWTAPIELDGNVDVPANKGLSVVGASVTVDGNCVFSDNGVIEVYGNATIGGQNNQWGTLTVGNGGVLRVKNNATLTLQAPLFFVLQAGANLILEDHATLNIKTNTTCGSGVNITVPATATLNVQSPAGELYLSAGCKLDVWGQLTGAGTPGGWQVKFDRLGSSGSWTGIIFEPGSTGSLSYCMVQHASTGIYCQSSSPTFQNSTISSNGYGFFASSCSPLINSNTLEDNTTVGIYLDNSSPHIAYTSIRRSPTGIHCTNHASPWLDHNTIENMTSLGVYCLYYSSPYFATNGYYYGGGYNRIRNNTNDNLSTYMYSNPWLGDGGYGGQNSLYNTTRNVSATYSSSVRATNNWWGADPPEATRFYMYQSSVIYYTPALHNNPNPLGAKQELGLDIAASGSVTSSSFSTPAAGSNRTLLDSAFVLQMQGKFTEAGSLYRQAVTSSTDRIIQTEALTRLSALYEQSGRSGFPELLRGSDLSTAIAQAEALQIVAAELEAYWKAQAGDYSVALKLLADLPGRFPSDPEVEKYALVSRCLLYARDLGDQEQAMAIWKEYTGKFSGNALVPEQEDLAPVLALYALVKQPAVRGFSATLAKATETTGKEEAATRIASFECYPNPFNPAVELGFTLPVASHASLAIYDLLGREVASLASGYHEAGVHSFRWDASGKASGLYFARLIVTDASGRRSYAKTNKLLLAK